MRKEAKTKNSRRTQIPRVDIEAAQIMRSVPDQEAFHFYEAIGKPTGETARNLTEFLDKVRSVKSESLMFHLQREDFQNWVEKTLGDRKLGSQLGKIQRLDDQNARKALCRTVENRIRKLESSLNIETAEILTVPLISS